MSPQTQSTLPLAGAKRRASASTPKRQSTQEKPTHGLCQTAALRDGDTMRFRPWGGPFVHQLTFIIDLMGTHVRRQRSFGKLSCSWIDCTTAIIYNLV